MRHIVQLMKTLKFRRVERQIYYLQNVNETFYRRINSGETYLLMVFNGSISLVSITLEGETNDAQFHF